jgi:hypothetical protein
VKALKTYQQLVIYFIPIITNLGFIHPVVIAVRLYWFKRKLKGVGELFAHDNILDVKGCG